MANVDWFVISHRLCIAVEAVKQGWKVFVAAEDTGRGHEINQNGVEFVDFRFSRSGTNPLTELNTLKKFKDLYRRIEPDVVHQVTLKPIIYGSIAAKQLGIKGVVNAVSGLGYTFTDGRQGLVQKLMLKMMKYGFNRPNLSIIFQNGDDQEVLTKLGAVNVTNRMYRIKGSGVDLDKFEQKPFPIFDVIKIVLPSRMLWDKGVKELCIATDRLKSKYKDSIQFILAGMVDSDNKAGVPEKYLREWEEGEYVKWIGYQKDMVAVYANSHIVVLPSYREGMPKTLIEACAIGRPIVTTDAVGCKECVDEGENGYKVPVGSVKELAEALEKLILNQEDILKMGEAGRLKAEREFDVKHVVAQHLLIYDELFKETR
ncbi:glycosyltransferase family 4 protein [Myroides odoratimimus]|nr:glycosyltransferase family 4 protein [Myroides odoratimimus]MDM1530438.1 glycosyltransferase family 4 protein [Myroides odoratimimus]